MIDVHCHLNFHAFDNDFEEVVKRATDARVEKIINVGTSIDSSKKAVELSEKYECLYAIIGIHPHHADKLDIGWENEIEKIAENKKVLAIGEIGLDYFSYKSNGIVDPKIQKHVFETQIELANKLKLPLQIHNRQAGEVVIDILTHHKNLLMDPPGMFHCFAGSVEVLKSALNLGFCIGFDGNITYDGIAKGETVALTELCKLTPMDRILTETDSPFLTPQPHRGSRNEPSYVIIVADFIAKIKGIPPEEIYRNTSENAHRIFNL